MAFLNILQILNQRATQQPDQLAFCFLNNKGEYVQKHTFASLSLRARSIAARLRQKVAPGDRVILLYSPGLDFVEAFFACLYAGALAVPAYPPRKNIHALRIQSIVKDAGANLALTTIVEKEKLEKNRADFPFMEQVVCWATDDIALAPDFTELAPAQPQDIAFLQYTSGSTGNPKGVMVAHDNIIYNLQALHRHTHFDEGDRMVSWLPLFHDMGLIYGILLPIYMGNTCYLMAPVSFITRPLLWLQTISKVKATHAVAPNFAFDLCADKLTREQVQNLDFGSIKYFANAAEPIREKSIRRFLHLLEEDPKVSAAISPAYGLAEATLVVSCADLSAPLYTCKVDQEQLAAHQISFVGEKEEGAPLVGSGKIVDGSEVKIVHPQTKRCCAPTEVGEVWVKGPTVAKGYWGKEELNREIFQAYTEDSQEGPYLRTGDLGFLHDEQLYITGRWKDLIIIDGVNHYPQDIEFAVQQLNEGLINGKGAAFSVDFGEGEKLVVVQELRSELSKKEPATLAELCQHIKAHLLHNFGLEAHAIVLVKKSGVPMTSSGKVRRKSCREYFLKEQLSVVAQSRDTTPASTTLILATRPELEAYVLGHLSRLLKIEKTAIDSQDSPLDLGLDSLAAMELRSLFQKDFNRKINLTELLQDHSIEEIIDLLFARITDTNGPQLPVTHFLSSTELNHYQEQDIDTLTEDQLDLLIASLEAEV